MKNIICHILILFASTWLFSQGAKTASIIQFNWKPTFFVGNKAVTADFYSPAEINRIN